MLSRAGWLAVAATGAAILLSLWTLELLLLLASVAAFALVTGEIVIFELELPREVPFTVGEREGPRVLSPGAEGSVSVDVRYNGARPMLAEVRDLLPGPIDRVSGLDLVRRRFAPGERCTLGYRIRAGGRGSHLLGPVAVTLESPHGLAWAQWVLPKSDRPVRVVPPAPIERAHRIGPALFTRVQGRLALRHRGYGTEFRSLRPYQPDDDLRHIAWKRSRPGQLYVREFEQESRQDFVLLLDITPSMLAGLPGENALDRAIEASSMVIAAVARSGEDRVGILTHTDRARQWLKPARGERHFRSLAENLAVLRPVGGSFELNAALAFLTRRLSTSTHVLAFSALDGPLEELHLGVARFRARGHHLYAFPPNPAGFYPPLDPDDPGAPALAWAEAEEGRELGRRVGELRGEGIPVFPYDRRGAESQVLSTYGQLRAFGVV